MRRETVFVYLWKFLGFRKNGEPFYRSYFLFKATLPKTFDDFQELMAKARREADRILNYYGLRARDVETFVIHRQGIEKGHTHTQFVNVFKSIGVDKHGRIRWMTAPSKSVNPEAYSIYNEYRIKRALDKHNKDDAFARLMGVKRERPNIKLRKVRTFGDRNPQPHELFGSEKLEFRQETNTFYFNDIIISLPQSIMATAKIETRKNLKKIDHQPFYL